MIRDLEIVPLRQIADDRGAVLHMIRPDWWVDRCGEVYFSEILPGVVKAWKRHSRMTQYLTVPVGLVRLVVWDDREGSASRGRWQELRLGRPDHYRLVKIPPGLWYGFQALAETPSLIANCTTLPHDPDEMRTLPHDAEEIGYRWPPREDGGQTAAPPARGRRALHPHPGRLEGTID